MKRNHDILMCTIRDSRLIRRSRDFLMSDVHRVLRHA